MLDRSRKPRLAGDNRPAKSVVEGAREEKPEKDPAAVSLGRRGGLKGGKSRAEKLSAVQRAEIASRAARARWGEPSG